MINKHAAAQRLNSALMRNELRKQAAVDLGQLGAMGGTGLVTGLTTAGVHALVNKMLGRKGSALEYLLSGGLGFAGGAFLGNKGLDMYRQLKQQQAYANDPKSPWAVSQRNALLNQLAFNKKLKDTIAPPTNADKYDDLVTSAVTGIPGPHTRRMISDANLLKLQQQAQQQAAEAAKQAEAAEAAEAAKQTADTKEQQMHSAKQETLANEADSAAKQASKKPVEPQVSLQTRLAYMSDPKSPYSVARSSRFLNAFDRRSRLRDVENAINPWPADVRTVADAAETLERNNPQIRAADILEAYGKMGPRRIEPKALFTSVR